MRKAIIPFLVAILSSGMAIAKGPEQSQAIYNFSNGLDSYHSSLSLPDGFVQDALNVYLGNAAPVEKRKGYTVVFSTQAFAYQGEWSYTDSNNTSWIIVRSSNQISASNLSGSIVKISTTSANDLVSEVNAFGNAYFVDPSQGVYYWDGTSTHYISGSPKGTLIAQFHGRVWVSGAAVPNGNQLYGSKYLDGTTWTIGVNPNDPVQFTVGLQDNIDNVTALYPFIDTMYVFKRYSISALYGFDQTNFQISFITGECGCIDAQSIQTFSHGLNFVSLRGVEFFDGYGCTRVSDPVKDKVDVAIQNQGGFNTQSWVQSSAQDFAAGIESSMTYTATGLAISTDNVNMPNYSFETGGGWTRGGKGCFANQSAFIGANCSQLTPKDGSFLAFGQTNQSIAQMVLNIIDANTSQNYGQFVLAFSSNSCSWVQRSIATTAPARTLIYLQFTGNIGNGTDTMTSNTFVASGVSTMTFYTVSDTAGGFPSWGFDFIQGGQTDITQGVMTSQSHSLGAITSFGNLSISQTLNNGTAAYSVCTSSSSTMVPKSCTPTTANSQITTSTNSFVQVIGTYTVVTASYTPVLQSFTVQWFTGSRTPSMASAVWDNRYWLALSTVAADNFNDSILVMNSDRHWMDFDIHAGGLTQYKNNLYHADSAATGNVYLDNQGYSDNGAAINAYIKTKDYFHDDLSQDDYIDSIWPTMDNAGNFNVSINYFVDRNSTSFPLSTVNQSEFTTNGSIKLPFPLDSAHQVFGKMISYQFTASDPNEPWKFYGFREIFHARPTQ